MQLDSETARPCGDTATGKEEASGASEAGLWHADLERKQVTLSPDAARMLGLAQRETTQPLSNESRFVHPGDRPRLRAAVLGALRGRAEFSSPLRIVRDDGVVVRCMVQGQWRLGPEGKPVSAFGALQAVPAKQAGPSCDSDPVQMVYRALSQCFEALVEAETAADLLSGACEALVGTGGYRAAWIGLFDENQPNVIRTAAQKQAACEGPTTPLWIESRTGEPLDFIAQALRSGRPWRSGRPPEENGELGPGLATPVLVAGTTLGVLAVHRARCETYCGEEIRLLRGLGRGLGYGLNSRREQTERANIEDEKRHIEAELRQSKKMESLGRLAGGVAHDFNNFLSIVLGYSDLALTEMGEEHELSEVIQEIQLAGLRARDLTRQLLAFSRKQKLELTAVDMNRLIADLRKMLASLLGETIVLDIKLDPGVPKILADPSQLQQVLFNLATNARDAMGEFGRLAIETHKRIVRQTRHPVQPLLSPGTYIELIVQDSGHGIPHGIQESIFDPFFTTKPEGQGTGLGLSTVRGIVEQHGGQVTVHSREGEGAAFRILLPMVRKDEPTAAAPGPGNPETARGSETILVVEDEEGVRRVASTILQRFGYKVLQARDPQDALALVREQTGRVDLLLADVVMPRMSGKDVYETLKRENPDLQVVYMSGYSGEIISQYGVYSGTTHFLQKPFSASALTNEVRHALDKA